MSTSTGGQSTQKSLLDTLFEHNRVTITASLEPTNGRFIQPTGFPDIGACIYRDRDGRRWCLVESEQSMANRLEAVCMKAPGVWVDELKGLPVIAVYDQNGGLLTTNLAEPHRIASSYVLEGKLDGDRDLRALIEQTLGLSNGGDYWPLDKRAALERLVFALDPGALLHGFQFVQWKFVGLRQTRLLHGRLEAELSEDPEVHYGMVKWDAIEPESTREERANKGQSIAAKSRIVPKEIVATHEVDVLGLKSLTLDGSKQKFLLALALWKIGAFLANKPAFDPRSRQMTPSLRLRADCYLRCRDVRWESDYAGDKTSPDELIQSIQGLSIQGLKPDDRSVSDAEKIDIIQELKFKEQINDVLGPENWRPDPDSSGLKYDGPVVKVTYVRSSQKARQTARPQPKAPEPEAGDEEEEEEGEAL